MLPRHSFQRGHCVEQSSGKETRGRLPKTLDQIWPRSQATSFGNELCWPIKHMQAHILGRLLCNVNVLVSDKPLKSSLKVAFLNHLISRCSNTHIHQRSVVAFSLNAQLF